MEKRALVAVVLSTLVFVVFQYYFAPKPTHYPPVQISQEEGVNREAEYQGRTRPQPSGKSPYTPLQKEGPEKVEQSVVVPKIEARDIRVRTGVTDVVLTNRGGKFKTLSLTEYTINGGENINLLKKEKEEGLSVSFRFGDEKLNRSINSANYRIEGNGDQEIVLSLSNTEEKIRFLFEDGSGLKIIKEYTFFYNEYRIEGSILVEDPLGLYSEMPGRIVWGGGISSDETDQFTYTGPTLLDDEKIISEIPDDKGEETLYSEKTRWVATQDKYFMAALIPRSLSRSKGFVHNLGDDMAEVGFEYKVKPGEGANYTIYAGPKKEELLEKYEVGLENIIDFGWFEFIGKPLFKGLKFFYRYTQNYGIAIIILTVIVKLIFFPLSHKSFKSMKEMQKIQPYMKILSERYKDDKAKLNKEMMKLYKENKVNPLGGCLPTLVQIPVFIALYRVLLNAIELRQAPFFLWITDLAAKDPYYVTPLLMGGSMFLQQKMTPTTITDPTQAKIMTFLPVIFTVMFLNFPAGLVLYWLVNNVLTIGQQYIIYRSDSK